MRKWPSLSVFFAPFYKALKQHLVFAGGRRHRFGLRLKDQRRSNLVARLRLGGTGKSRGDEREKRYTSETQSVHIGLFLTAIGCD